MVDKRKKPTNKQLNVSVEVYDRLKLKFGESISFHHESISDVIARTLNGLEKK
jgi:hypothetical protein